MRKSLITFCSLNMGQSPDSNSYNERGQGLPFYQGNADFGVVNPITRVWCDSPIKIAEKGDILISVRAPIGAVNIAVERCCIGRGLAALTPFDVNCDRDFLFYVLQSKVDELNRKGNGSTFKAITKFELAETQIPVYSIKKQQEIAHKLMLLDRLISRKNEQVKKMDLLVKSRFVEMFGDVNVNDKGWSVRPLGELCTIVRGGSPRPIDKYLGGDVPWIKIGDATYGDNIYLNSTKEHIIQEGVAKSRLVKSGSLIFANCGVSLGFARIITFDGCIHDGWLAMEDIDSSIDKIFLLQVLNQMTKHFRDIAPAGTQPNLNTSIMKAYKQIIPSMDLQKEYIAFVEQVEKSKLELQKSLEKLETLKKALMQKYFG